MSRSRWFVFLGVLLIAGTLGAQDLVAPQEADAAASGEPEGPAVLGFIFNTTNLLLDLDAYQGGFGAKLRFPDYGLRLLVSLGYASTFSEISAGSGVTYEKPFFPGRVTPYWGLLADVLFEGENVRVDADNYTKTNVITGTAGAVLGIEVFVFDFLSVFGEYQLAADVSYTSISQAVSGTVTDPTSTNFAFGAGLGNAASIGVVVYLQPLGIVEPKAEPEAE